MKGRCYHLTAAWHDGTAEFEECPRDIGETAPQIVLATPAVAGKAVPPGCRLVSMRPQADGKHFVREDLDGGERRGPAVMNAKAFRAGWERTFGRNGVN